MSVEHAAAPFATKKGRETSHEPAGFTIEGAPALGTIFEQFGCGLAELLSSICGQRIKTIIGSVCIENIFENLSHMKGWAVSTLRCTQLNTPILILFDDPMVQYTVATAFGGDPDGDYIKAGRAHTRLEMDLLQLIAGKTAHSFKDALASLGETSVELEDHQILADARILGHRDFPVVQVKIRLENRRDCGQVSILIPVRALSPYAGRLSGEDDVAPPNVDPNWTRELTAGVGSTPVSVKGVLESLELTLGEITELCVGEVLHLRGSTLGRVLLESGGRNLFWCKLNQADGIYSLEVGEPVTQFDSLEMTSALR